MAAPQWSYTFCDARTDAELATLPMVHVDFEKVLNGTGRFNGVIPTVDPAIRALDPWTASIPRRTALYVSYGDTMVWGGLIWQRERSQDTGGLKIMATTFDAYLASQLLTVDMNFANATANTIVPALLRQVQSLPGANLHIATSDVSASIPGQALRNRYWARSALKDVLQLLQTMLQSATPIEWRIDCAWTPSGGISKTLVFGEPRIGRTTDVSGLYAFHDVTHPGSTLLSFDDTEDGMVQANACAGSIQAQLLSSATLTTSPRGAQVSLLGSGTLTLGKPQQTATTDAPTLDQQGYLTKGKVNTQSPISTTLWSFHTAADVGFDEVAAGYPLSMKDVSTAGQSATINTQSDLDDVVLGAVYDVQSQGKQLTNFSVRPDLGDGRGGLPITGFDVGDNLDCAITHPAYVEFPNPTLVPVRILGRKITPRSPNTPDKIDLTVWDATSPRLPRSTTLVAHLRDIQRRVKALEQE